jgi:hypothetical protein
MAEILYTGEWTEGGYEYPPKCPLGICGGKGGGDPLSMSFRNGAWECDECGKKFVAWTRVPDPPAT